MFPLLGQIEMLAVRNAYCEEATLALLAEERKDYSKISEYDDFGMLKRIDIHRCGRSLLSNTYESLSSLYPLPTNFLIINT